jgi:hypothetical protein
MCEMSREKIEGRLADALLSLENPQIIAERPHDCNAVRPMFAEIRIRCDVFRFALERPDPRAI